MNNSEAKQVILEADSCFCKHGAYKDCHSGCKYREALDAAVKALEQEPKMGQWIIYNYPGHECVYCSSCKEEYYEDDLYMGGSDFPKYCPNCGCRMVEPQESEET